MMFLFFILQQSLVMGTGIFMIQKGDPSAAYKGFIYFLKKCANFYICL